MAPTQRVGLSSQEPWGDLQLVKGRGRVGRRARGRLALGMITRLLRKSPEFLHRGQMPSQSLFGLHSRPLMPSLLGVVPKVGNPRCFSTKGAREGGEPGQDAHPPEAGAQAWSSG